MMQYERLGSALDRLARASAGEVVEAYLYVVVLEGTQPRRSSGAGSDHFVNLKVTDPLSNDNLGALELMVFGQEDKLPAVRPLDTAIQQGNIEAGDILRLTHVKLQRYRLKPQLMLTMKYESKKPNKNLLAFHQDPPDNQQYHPYCAYYYNFTVREEDMRELDIIRRALQRHMQGLAPSHNPFAMPSTGLPPHTQPGGSGFGPAPANFPGPGSGALSHGASMGLQLGGRPGLPLHTLPNGLPPVLIPNQQSNPQQQYPTPPVGCNGAVGQPAMPLKPPTAVFGTLPAGSTIAAAAPGALAAGPPTNITGPGSNGERPQVAEQGTTATGDGIPQQDSSTRQVAPAAAGDDAPIVYPRAAANTALVKLSSLPEHCQRAPLQLVDLFAQVVACDKRLVGSHGVILLYLWDGTDMPLLRRRIDMLPALPYGNTTLPCTLPRRRFAMPLACMTASQETGQGNGTTVVEQLPTIGSILPMIVPATAVDGVPPVSSSWIKLRKLSICVHQGQIQAVWLSASKWAGPGRAKPEVIEMAAARLASDKCTCHLAPKGREQLAALALTDAQEMTPLLTLRQVLSQRPAEPVRVLACITGHHPQDLSECMIGNQDDTLPPLPPEECAHGHYCLLKVRLEDATGELDAILVGAQAANFFAGLRLNGPEAQQVDSLRAAMARLEGDDGTMHEGPVAQQHGSSHAGHASRKRQRDMDGPASPAAGVLSALWGEFCLWPVCLRVQGTGQGVCRLYHIVDTTMMPS